MSKHQIQIHVVMQMHRSLIPSITNEVEKKKSAGRCTKKAEVVNLKTSGAISKYTNMSPNTRFISAEKYSTSSELSKIDTVQEFNELKRF